MNNSSKVNKQITVIVGLVINEGKLLMVKRHEPEVKGAHQKWEFPGGKVDIGETPEQAIVREVKEETGVICKVKRLLPVTFTNNWEYPWGIQHTLIFGFECEFVNEGMRKEDHHVEDTEWVPLKDVLQRENLPGAKEFLDALSV